MSLDITCTHLFKQHVVSGPPPGCKSANREGSRNTKKKEYFCFCTLTTCGKELWKTPPPRGLINEMQGRLQPGSAAGLAMVAILAQQVLASLCSSPATCACVLGPLAQTHGRTRQCAPRNRASAKRMCAGALASLAGARTLCTQSLCARDRAVWRAKRTRRALTRLRLRGIH